MYDIVFCYRKGGSQGILNQGVMSGGLRPPILKFSLQVGDVWFCGFYPAFPLNGEFWPGDMSGGYVRSPRATFTVAVSLHFFWKIKNPWVMFVQTMLFSV